MKCPKCGWQNLPDSKECLQCSSGLGAKKDTVTYPPRAGKKSKFTAANLGKWKRKTPGGQNSPGEGSLNGTNRRVVRDLSIYINIALTTVAGFIPGVVQLLRGQIRRGRLLLTSAILLILLFLLFIKSSLSSFILITLTLLAIFSSFDAVVNFYKSRKLLLNGIIRFFILFTSVSIFFLVRFFFTGAINTYYVRIIIPNNSLTPVFLQGDEILFSRNAYKYILPEQGDIVAVRYRNTVTVERIIGVPGNEVKIKKGIIYIDDELVKKENYPLSEFAPITASIGLPKDHYFIFVYLLQQGTPTLVAIPKKEILGKFFLIIHPPERRGRKILN